MLVQVVIDMINSDDLIIPVFISSNTTAAHLIEDALTMANYQLKHTDNFIANEYFLVIISHSGPSIVVNSSAVIETVINEFKPNIITFKLCKKTLNHEMRFQNAMNEIGKVFQSISSRTDHSEKISMSTTAYSSFPINSSGNQLNNSYLNSNDNHLIMNSVPVAELSANVNQEASSSSSIGIVAISSNESVIQPNITDYAHPDYKLSGFAPSITSHLTTLMEVANDFSVVPSTLKEITKIGTTVVSVSDTSIQINNQSMSQLDTQLTVLDRDKDLVVESREETVGSSTQSASEDDSHRSSSSESSSDNDDVSSDESETPEPEISNQVILASSRELLNANVSNHEIYPVESRVPFETLKEVNNESSDSEGSESSSDDSYDSSESNASNSVTSITVKRLKQVTELSTTIAKNTAESIEVSNTKTEVKDIENKLDKSADSASDTVDSDSGDSDSKTEDSDSGSADSDSESENEVRVSISNPISKPSFIKETPSALKVRLKIKNH